MTIYQMLEKYQARRKSFEDNPEFEFFIKNREILMKFNRFEHLYSHEKDEFDVLRANIILRAYFNKQTIELEVKNIASKVDKDNMDLRKFHQIVKERILGLPFLTVDKVKIYIPFFNVPLNIIYSNKPEKLLSYPYNLLEKDFGESIIDLFDTYGAKLYDSYFTSLINVYEYGDSIAYLNYDTNTIYIVNSQGRLDNQIVLFDKYVKNPSYSHMLERLRPVLKAYYEDNRREFIDALLDNKFISAKLVSMIKDYD